MLLKTSQIKTIKQIIKATECNSLIIHCYMILSVTINSLVTLSIQMISEANHILNIKIEFYHYSAQLISLKTKYINQTTVHHINIKKLIITYHTKMSLHTTLTSLNHIMLIFSSITLHSHKTATSSICATHIE